MGDFTMERTLKLLLRVLPGFTVAALLAGCVLQPVNEKDVVGTYQSVLQDGIPGLPDGGSEILELKADGTCKQEVSLKDGRTFSAQGTWEWKSDGSDASKRVLAKGIYWVVADKEKINPDLETSTKNVVQSLSVSRTFEGRVLLGSREGTHYEKK